MDTLFIDRKDTSLETEAGRLILRIPGQRPSTLPLKQLRYVVLAARVDLSTTVLLAMEQHGITLVVTNPRKSDNYLVCCGVSHGNTLRRVSQIALVLDDKRRLDAAKAIVSAKLLYQYSALARHRRRRPDLRRDLTRGMDQLVSRWRAVADASSLHALRGLEGAGAAAYFAAFTHLFAAEWQFAGRKKRPPPDPVNAILSLTYTLVHGEAVHALLSAGLDPAVGVLHDLQYYRESLACDLVELLRPRCESWVVDMFRQRQLRTHHFQKAPGGACLLDKEGRTLFYPAYHQMVSQWRTVMRDLAHSWSKRVDAQCDWAGDDIDESPHTAD